MKRTAGPLAPLYYSGQFVPLIVFFLLFLSIVKNNKLHHFVRFHTMQVSAPPPPPLCTRCSAPPKQDSQESGGGGAGTVATIVASACLRAP